ncbi:MAG: type I restriction enzyme HsdR N-terminal domain-containing protein [Actinomycetia bacterium]|nr:type I restriction enzyme HsdR N-terminal domain-containing protein [Actinomycetes bacterium]
MKVPAKVQARVTAALKRFQPVLSSALARDVNESDTAAIVTDILAEIFGYDKYHEVTSEHQIRSTYCDLAIDIEGRVRLLLECKAIGLDLKEKHVRQAVNYAANQGVDWVVLTNAINWQVYKIDFAKPVKEELVLELNMLELNPRAAGTVEDLFLLTREGLMKSALPDYYVQKQATSRFVLGAIVLSDPVVTIVRRELKRVSPDVKVSLDQVRDVLEHEVLKREVVESEKAKEAKRKVQKTGGKARGKKASLAEPMDTPEEPDAEVTEEPQIIPPAEDTPSWGPPV